MIERDMNGAAGRRHDMVVVGGGMQGVAIALEAALRGRRPLLLERDDFGGGTTWNHLRIVHGGLRYLQKLDLPRFFESVAERRWFLRHFPDLVQPLPCMMPLYGDGLKRPATMRAALLLNDALSARRNRGVRADRVLGKSRVLSAEETAAVFPSVRPGGLQGAAHWFDAVAARPERLLVEMLRWACSAGATALNRVEAVGVMTEGGAVEGIRAVDRVSGRELEFRTPLVINAAGPWTRELAATAAVDDPDLFHPSLAFNLFLRRTPLSDSALAVSAPAPGSRIYFLLPWHEGTLVGTYHAPWRSDVPLDRVPEQHVEAMIGELNTALPSWDLSASDVVRVYAGLLPAEAEGGVDLTRRPVVRFHGENGGPRGLVSVVAIKFTTARHVAATILDHLLDDSARATPAPRPPALSVVGRDEIISLASQDPEGADRIVSTIVGEESVVDPEDVYLRRSGWGRDPAHAGVLDTLVRSAMGGGATMDSEGADDPRRPGAP